MLEEDYIYFAQELHEITPRIIPSKYGNIYSLTAGVPGQPLILVVHGSGPKNSADQYAYLLHQYLVRISYVEKFYIVAIDCPGYGRSEGSKQAVKTFPLQLFQQILSALKYKNYFAMLGHSQGGAAIFNAVFQQPTITQFLVMDRPVCGNIQRFRDFSLPTLLIYDIQDDGHPIWQGKLLYKELKNTQLFTYRNSTNQFWVPDNIWQTMLNFFAKQFKQQRKFHLDLACERKNKSVGNKSVKKSVSKAKKDDLSVDKIEKIKKIKKQEQKLIQIEEVQKSELLSVYSSQRSQQLQKIEIPSQAQKIQIPDEIRQQFKDEIKMQKKKYKQQEYVKPKQMIKQKIEEKSQKISKQEMLKDEQKCAICYEILYRPITTNCNHHFCNKCIMQALLVNQKCPLCRAKITKKTENKQLHEKLVQQMQSSDIVRREKEFKRIETMMKSIVYIQIGNNSRQLQTKQSIFTKTKKKYIWELFVKQPRNFPIEEVGFNINMGDSSSKPVKIRNAPFVFESRGTFSFACQITIKPKNKEYADIVDIYRINVEPGCHTKVIALKKKCYTK